MDSKLSLGHLAVIHQELYALRGDYFLIIFGVTTGLLVLVGFASLYVMTDSSKRVEELRELSLQLTAIKHKACSRRLSDETIDSIYKCMDRLSRTKSTNPELISLLMITICFIMLSWLSTVILLDSTMEFALFGAFYAISSCILLTFVVKLNKFRKSTTASLASVQQLLDVNENRNMDVVHLAAVTSRVLLRRDPKNDDEISIYLGFPQFTLERPTIEQHFCNLKLVQPSIYLRNGNTLMAETVGLSQVLSKSADCIPGSSYDWYEVKFKELIDLHPVTKTVEIVLFLTSQREKQSEFESGLWVTYGVDCDYDHSMSDVMLYPSHVQEGVSTEKIKRVNDKASLQFV